MPNAHSLLSRGSCSSHVRSSHSSSICEDNKRLTIPDSVSSVASASQEKFSRGRIHCQSDAALVGSHESVPKRVMGKQQNKLYHTSVTKCD